MRNKIVLDLEALTLKEIKHVYKILSYCMISSQLEACMYRAPLGNLYHWSRGKLGKRPAQSLSSCVLKGE